ncbi:hypothetical protein C8R43DRAFT_1001573 [Mycena crocata]|nr:hypothetical protein C8R43DRAFT_1001573 [Mycena crocata]
MRFFLVTLITFFALLFTLASATTTTMNTDDNGGGHARVSMSFFRPWTWTFPLPAMVPPDAAAQHVRRHGPRRRAMHP